MVADFRLLSEEPEAVAGECFRPVWDRVKLYVKNHQQGPREMMSC